MTVLRTIIGMGMVLSLSSVTAQAVGLKGPEDLVQDPRSHAFYERVVSEIGYRSGAPLSAAEVSQILHKMIAYAQVDQVAFRVLLHTLQMQGHWIPTDSANGVMDWILNTLLPGGAKMGVREQMQLLVTFLRDSHKDPEIKLRAAKLLQSALGLTHEYQFRYPPRVMRQAAFLALWEDFLRAPQNTEGRTYTLLLEVFARASEQEDQSHTGHPGELIPGLSAALLHTLRLPELDLVSLLDPIGKIASKSGLLQREWIGTLIQHRLKGLKERLMQKLDITPAEEKLLRDAVHYLHEHYPLQEDARGFLQSLVEDRVVVKAKAEVIKRRILETQWTVNQLIAPIECERMLGRFRN